MRYWVFTFLLAAEAAFGNDSTFGFENSEIVYMPNEAIELKREDLYLSPSMVKVAYQFQNLTDQDQTLDIVFPVVRAKDVWDGDIDVATQMNSDQNESGSFVTRLNGHTLPATKTTVVEFKGENVTTYFEERGIDPTRFDYGEYQEDMKNRGYLDEFDTPTWSVTDYYTWQAVFPANQMSTVHHEYDPSASSGFTAVGEVLLSDDKFCIDDHFMAGVQKYMDAHPEAPYMVYQEIDYLLGPGRNWAGPIGEINVTVDKGSPDALVSFCANNVEKISPTQFRYQLRDYEPEDGQIINVLVLRNAN